MANDESLVDAAQAPPVDRTPRADSPQDSSPAPKRPTTRGRTVKPKLESAAPVEASPVESAPKARRAPRTRKSAAPSTETTDPIVEIADAGTIPAAPKPAISRRGRAGRKVVSEESALPPALPVEPPVEPAAPVRGRRRGAQSAAAPGAAPKPTETIDEKPARRGRGRRRPDVAADVALPESAPTESAPVESAAQPESIAERRRARRTSERGRARKARAASEASPDPIEPGVRIAVRRGLPELHIHGEAYPPSFFFGSMEGENETRRVTSEAKRAAGAGIHLYSTLVEIPSPLPPVDSVYDNLDNRLQALLDADPKGYLMPRLVFVPAPGWVKGYPNEVSQFASGKSADPSIASDRFWKDVEFALESIVEHIKRMPYGSKVIGYHLERGEWFNPADNGYDRSFANREAFRDWLRAKYKHSSLSLRASWFDGDVQFHTVEIPEMPDPRTEMAFFDSRKERRWIDFLEYSSDITADRLIALSRAVKRATDDQALVSVCYGYTFEFEHTFSGHLALDRILKTPSIDLICGPPSYKDRQPGQAGSFPSPVDSIALHGKLWISEDDTKTHLAPADPTGDDFNPHLQNRWDTEQVHLRAIGKAMAHQSGIAWMDLWGEGWLDGDDIWNRAGWFASKYREYLKSRKAESPEVVVLVDERSLLHIQKGGGFLKRILQAQREAIQRAGASVGFYLQSDLTSKAFPTDAKLYIFLNPYRLPAEQREAIKEKLQNGGKTLAWIYAVGVCDERGTPDESAHELVGIALRQQSWNAEVGSRITDSRHAVTNRIAEREFGARERINPSFYVDDDEPGLTALAEYAQSGLTSMALREFNGWRSVFLGEPAITTDLIRGLCKYAGVHLYTTYGDDYVTVGHGWLTLHAVREGNRTLVLPPGTALYDLTESKVLVEGVTEHKLFAKARSTRTFVVAPLEELRKLGLPGADKPRGRRRSAPVEPAAEEIPPVPAETPEEPADIADSSDLSDQSDLSDDSAAADDRSRRRRRRGGRGRGRRSAGSAAAPSEGT